MTGGISGAATRNASTVGGGIDNTASNDFAAVGGGHTCWTNNAYATIPGSLNNTAGGANSFAGGTYATVLSGHHGSMLFSDDTYALSGIAFNSAVPVMPYGIETVFH